MRKAVESTGLANGPVVTIPNGIDLSEIARVQGVREDRIFIAGAKNPALARTLSAKLTDRGVAVDLGDTLVPRERFLERMASASIAVLLPDPHEGFFVAGARGDGARHPGCGAALRRRGRFLHRWTNLLLATSHASEDILAAVLGLRSDPTLADALRREGGATAREHSLKRERATFLAVMHDYLTTCR